MNLKINAGFVASSPAFASPLRLGILVHLAALVDPKENGDLKFQVSPKALAEILTATRPQVEAAITTLAEHGLIGVDKHVASRGVWEICLRPCAEYLHEGDVLKVPIETPVDTLMRHWNEGYEKATGTRYLRMTGDFWREKKDWITLYSGMGEKVFTAMHRFFRNKKYAQWGFRFSVFFRSAQELAKKKQETGWS